VEYQDYDSGVTVIVFVFLAGVVGWWTRRAGVLLVPVAVAVFYLAVGGGGDSPILAVALLAELGLVGGRLAHGRLSPR
jgi:hypothetical protein